MAYVVLAVGSLFSLFWLVGLLFAFRTKGDRSLLIPSFWLLAFLGLATFGQFKLIEAQQNPDLLTSENYLKLTRGMSPSDALVALGGTSPDIVGDLDTDQLKKYDLTSNQITLPSEVKSRLSPGKFVAEREDAEITLSFDGEPSGLLNRRPKDAEGAVLGLPATEELHGVKGLHFRFLIMDEEKTTAIREERQAAIEEAEEAEKDLPVYTPIITPAQRVCESPEATEDEEEDSDPVFCGEDDSCPTGSTCSVKEWSILEGRDWTYEANKDEIPSAASYLEAANAELGEDEEKGQWPTAEHVALAVQEAINKNHGPRSEACASDEEWNAVDSVWTCPGAPEDAPMTTGQWVAHLDVDEDPTKVTVQPLAEGLLGEDGNQLMAQCNTGLNLALKIGLSKDGESQRFYGGNDSARIDFWTEDDTFFDDDFIVDGRMVAVGYKRGKLMGAGQRGLAITPDQEPVPIIKKTAE
jgi:hypothetical protein